MADLAEAGALTAFRDAGSIDGMWLDAFLVFVVLAVGYMLGRLHSRRLADRERVFAALANLPDWEIRARDLERRAYHLARRHGRLFDIVSSSDVAALQNAADVERLRGRQRDVQRGS